MAIYCPPPKQYEYLIVHIGIVLNLACSIFLLVKFASEYSIFVRRIRSEYSETTDREIAWSWICFFGYAVQSILFIAYQLFWSPTVEIIYQLLTIVNLGYLCFSISRQRTIDVDVVNDSDTLHYDNKPDERTLIPDIEHKLRTMCEDKLLFLTPDITLETLALRLGTNRTYMGIYFRERNLTFYQYINTLRIEYANRLMQDNPHLPLRKVAEQSGFRSQPTFRKAFQEVMGCLPSEVKK